MNEFKTDFNKLDKVFDKIDMDALDEILSNFKKWDLQRRDEVTEYMENKLGEDATRALNHILSMNSYEFLNDVSKELNITEKTQQNLKYLMGKYGYELSLALRQDTYIYPKSWNVIRDIGIHYDITKEKYIIKIIIKNAKAESFIIEDDIGSILSIQKILNDIIIENIEFIDKMGKKIAASEELNELVKSTNKLKKMLEPYTK